MGFYEAKYKKKIMNNLEYYRTKVKMNVYKQDNKLKTEEMYKHCR